MIVIPLSALYDDLWSAQQLIGVCGDHLRWTPQRGWLVWDGARWAPDTLTRVHEYAMAMVLQWRADADALTNKALRDWAAKCGSHNKLTTIVNRAALLPQVKCLDEQFDTHPHLFNTNNGTLDLRTGAMKDPDPLDYLTQVAPIAYVPAAQCPRFRHTLDGMFNGNQEMIGFVQRVFGYCLTGDTVEKVFFIFHGPKNTGKSTLLAILRAILGGDYATEAQYGTFFVQKYQKVRDDIAELAPYRAVTASEPERSSELANGLIKQLVGDTDAIRARALYQNSQQFQPRMKILIATNHLPTIDDSDIWDRVRLIPCMVQWAMPDLAVEGELTAIKGLAASLLQEEAEGILAWMVEGAKVALVHGLQPPAEVIRAGQTYQNEQDIVQDFLDEMITEGEEILLGTLHSIYIQWFGLRIDPPPYRNHRPLSKIMLTKELTAKGYQKEHKADGWVWLGIKLRPLAQTVEARKRN